MRVFVAKTASAPYIVSESQNRMQYSAAVPSLNPHSLSAREQNFGGQKPYRKPLYTEKLCMMAILTILMMGLTACSTEHLGPPQKKQSPSTENQAMCQKGCFGRHNR